MVLKKAKKKELLYQQEGATEMLVRFREGPWPGGLNGFCPLIGNELNLNFGSQWLSQGDTLHICLVSF